MVSLAAVYSASSSLAYAKHDGNVTHYLLRQMVFIIAGLVLIFLCHKINYNYYAKIAKYFLMLSIPLLFLTLVGGQEINEARRWLKIPIINLSFQTSDFAKLSLTMYLALMISKATKYKKGEGPSWWFISLPVVGVCVLVAPADLSTSAMLFLTSLILMFIGRVDVKHLISLFGIILVSFSVFVLSTVLFPDMDNRVSVWKNRITTYVEGTDSHQEKHANIAIANGSCLHGLGPGNSKQRNILPHPYSDFIYAIIIEEYGFLGGLLMVILYMTIFHRAIEIFKKSPGHFGALLAVGLAIMVVLQALTNMMVNVGIFPVTGIPLPLVSMGGTSILFTSLALGIILSVSSFIESDKVKKKRKKKYVLVK